MAPTKKSKKSTAVAASSTPQAVITFTASELIGKAHTLLAQSNHELAIRFLERALDSESGNLEAKELLGIAELEGGDPDVGRQHLLELFPPSTSSPPTHPSPYLYLAQASLTPQESLSYFSQAVQILHARLASPIPSPDGIAADKESCVKCLIAMVELWMTDLSDLPEASDKCDDLIAEALKVDERDVEARLVLSSIRLQQGRIDEARAIVDAVFEEVESKEPCTSTTLTCLTTDDESLPILPVRILLAKQLLEHDLTSSALLILSLVRSEDALNVEAAYLEGWAWYLRAEALTSGTIQPTEDEPETAEECYAEAMRALLEAAKEHENQEHGDEGIAVHLGELLEVLEGRGTVPAVEEDEDEEDVVMKD